MTPIEALRTAADAMRRADPAYCAAHQVEQITDGEWDAVLELVEDACEAAPPAPAAQPSAESVEWLFAQWEEYQRRAHDAEREVQALRAQIGGGR
jgi:truncated hemoglobin YjbI